MAIRFLSAFLSTILLFPFVLSVVDEKSAALLIIILVSYLVFAVPFSLIIDAFIGRMERLGALAKNSLKIILFLMATAIMATYILFLTKAADDQTVGPAYLIFMLAAVIYIFGEWLAGKLIRKWQQRRQ